MSYETNMHPWKHFSEWMSIDESYRWQKIIMEKVIWERPFVRVFGKSFIIPRKTAFIAKPVAQNLLYYTFLLVSKLCMRKWSQANLNNLVSTHLNHS